MSCNYRCQPGRLAQETLRRQLPSLFNTGECLQVLLLVVGQGLSGSAESSGGLGRAELASTLLPPYHHYYHHHLPLPPPATTITYDHHHLPPSPIPTTTITYHLPTTITTKTIISPYTTITNFLHYLPPPTTIDNHRHPPTTTYLVGLDYQLYHYDY